ncbi:MAG: penicillin-binding protein dacF [Parcubacteria group bacterium Gr01-1014_107]|nr:MAG: penicillin-binding protein dacF [Parcubacteria group bacterium Gr01-1014_107]
MNYKRWINGKSLSTTAILSSLFIASLVLPGNFSKKTESKVNSPNLIREKTAQRIEPLNFFRDIKLTARGVFVWDIKNQKVLFEHNSSAALPLASLTKTLLALTAYETLPANTEINIDKDFLKAEGDTGLFADERWRMKELIDFSLLTSSNDAALAIASVAGAIKANTSNYNIGRGAFVELMNNRAQQLNLESIVIKNESGLDKDSFESGAYGNARDIALLFEYLLKNHPEILELTILSQTDFVSLSGKEHQAKNTNIAINEIPGLIASKTGFTDLAGGNLAIVFDPTLGRPIIIVVLGSSFADRFTDALKLAQATKEYLEKERASRKALP